MLHDYSNKKKEVHQMNPYSGSLFVVALCSLLMAGRTRKQPEQEKQTQTQQPAAQSSSSAAGVHWTVPAGWISHPASAMRVATYVVPAAEDDPEGGECAVFYFGSNRGGDIDANIERWIGQFEQGSTHSKSPRQINGLNVTVVSIAGTYLAPSGPMMQSQGKKENHRLLGGIVEAPEGLVFFKFTGPAKTVAAAEKAFNELIGSLTRE